MASITLHKLTKTFAGNQPAVRDLSLAVREGELLVLVGPSGSGKSTTLRLIAGLEHPSSGEIRIGGELVNPVPPHKRGVAMVFQNYTLYPHMTVERNLAFGIERGVARGDVRQRIAAAAEVLKIDHLLKRYPGELSGGERQRTALAKAMVRRPRAFLFDEPLSNLDLRLRYDARAEIKSLHRRLSATTIHVTHDQEEAMMLGDRIAVLDRGELQQLGSPTATYRSPTNAFVAAFIGSPSMNFVPGSLSKRDGQTEFVEDVAGYAAHLPPLRLPLAPELASRLPPTPMVLGFRPQATRPEPGSLNLTVSLVEPLGEWVDLVCTISSGRTIIARLPAETGADPGQHLRLSLREDDLFFFAPGERGRNLLAAGPPPADS